jgi:hypothetical protein
MAEPDAPRAADETLTTDDLHRLARQLDLVPIPPHLAERVLAAVLSYRATLRRFDEAGIEVADVVTAQPLRADERGRLA